MDISTTDVATLVQDERDEFVEFLADLTPEQWGATSLCTDWTVKQLALHYLSSAETSPGRLLGALAASGFSPDRAGTRLIREREQLRHDEVVARPRALPAHAGLHRFYKPAACYSRPSPTTRTCVDPWVPESATYRLNGSR